MTNFSWIRQLTPEKTCKVMIGRSFGFWLIPLPWHWARLDGVIVSCSNPQQMQYLWGESICRKPYFGVKGGERVFLKILGNGESVSSLEDAREELSFSFAELEDFALESRSLCIHSLDRKQMDEVIYLFIILSLSDQNWLAFQHNECTSIVNLGLW